MAPIPKTAQATEIKYLFSISRTFKIAMAIEARRKSSNTRSNAANCAISTNATLRKEIGSVTSLSSPDKSFVPGKTASAGCDKYVGIVAKDALTINARAILIFR